MLTTLAGSAALDAVINKSASPAFPLLYPCDSSACSAGRGGLAETGDILAPWSLEAAPNAHSQHPKPEHSGRGKGADDSADLFWGKFSPWSQRHAVPWIVHNNGIPAIGANSFLDVRKELWNSVSKIREKFLRQPESFGEHVTSDCPSCEQNKQWHYKSQDCCAVCPYLTFLKSEKHKKLGN